MTEHDLEFQQQLRAWLRSEVAADLAAPASLRMAMAAIPATVPTRGADRRWVVLAVALAATVVMATAAAVGSGLIRLPEPPRPDVIPLGGPCVPSLEDELLIAVRGEGPDGNFFVYRDGLVISWFWHAATNADAVLQRRLTDSGVEALMAAATASGLDTCRDIPVQGVPGALRIEVRDGSVVNAFRTGHGQYSLGEDDAAITAAAAALYAQLSDPDLQIPADQWVDPAWMAYVPDRYLVTALLPSSTEPTSTVAPLDEIWDDTLPDGSTPRTLGRAITGRAATGYEIHRCAEMGADQVRELKEHLTTVLGPSFEGRGLGEEFSAWFDGGGMLYATQAYVPPLSCADVQAESDTDEPQNPDPDLMTIDVCRLLEGAALPGGGTVGPDRIAWVASDASSCDFWEGGDYLPFYRVSLRVWPTSAAEALELVRLAFGDGSYRVIEMGEATAYRNCDACSPAIVVSVDPYLLVIDAGSPNDVESKLRALAETAIERLPD